MHRTALLLSSCADRDRSATPKQTSEKEILRKELASGTHQVEDGISEDVIYKIDIPANRYDMLCVEGISRALNIFRGVQGVPVYQVAGDAATTPRPLDSHPSDRCLPPPFTPFRCGSPPGLFLTISTMLGPRVSKLLPYPLNL